MGNGKCFGNGLSENEQHRRGDCDGDPLALHPEKKNKQGRCQRGNGDVDRFISDKNRDEKSSRVFQEDLHIRQKGVPFFPHLMKMQGR